MIWVLEIKEKAIGKGRPKFNSITKRAYTPEKTQMFEQLIQWYFLSKYKLSEKPSNKAIKAEIDVVYKPAKTASRKSILMVNGKSCTKKPDLDNIVKSILDALNGIAYEDDSQVSELIAKKRYGDEDRITIKLEEIE